MRSGNARIDSAQNSQTRNNTGNPNSPDMSEHKNLLYPLVTSVQSRPRAELRPKPQAALENTRKALTGINCQAKKKTARPTRLC
jgi:hypothetical protein